MAQEKIVYTKNQCRLCERPAYIQFNAGERGGPIPFCHSHFVAFRMYGGAWAGNPMLKWRRDK